MRVGGPAVAFEVVSSGDSRFSGIAKIGGGINALPHHNPNATFTTRGCIRRCAFCTVPVIESEFRELADSEWIPKPLICDNNLLAASQQHFDHVVDRLGESGIVGIDFNQGLDARLLTHHHAKRLAELRRSKQLKMVRLAWDHIGSEQAFKQAHWLLRRAGIPASKISVYILIGYNDTPEEALYRLSEVWKLKSWPNPMRYQPLSAVKRNGFVGLAWTHRELMRFVRYWSNLRHLSGVPFEEFTT